MADEWLRGGTVQLYTCISYNIQHTTIYTGTGQATRNGMSGSVVVLCNCTRITIYTGTGQATRNGMSGSVVVLCNCTHVYETTYNYINGHRTSYQEWDERLSDTVQLHMCMIHTYNIQIYTNCWHTGTEQATRNVMSGSPVVARHT